MISFRPADDSRRRLALIGVPTSAAAFAPGQEQAPGALRAAGLPAALADVGFEVHDRGDRAVWRWRPDRKRRDAQNVPAIVEIVRETTARVGDALDDGMLPLVLGGDCTVGIGMVAAQVARGGDVGLVYFDSHADLNVPGSVTEGALDWMGMAHMLAVDGAVQELVEVGTRVPLMHPDQVLVFGWGPDQATPFERGEIQARGIRTIPASEVEEDPTAAAGRARQDMENRFDRYVVHFDVDVIDFTDVPLSENWGRNEGLAYATTLRALDELLKSPRLAGLTVTELNPDHTEDGSDTLTRFVQDLAAALG